MGSKKEKDEDKKLTDLTIGDLNHIAKWILLISIPILIGFFVWIYSL